MRPIAALILTIALVACEEKMSAPSREQTLATSLPPSAPRPGRPGSGGGGIGGVGAEGGMSRAAVDVAEPDRAPGPTSQMPAQTNDTPQQAMIIKNGDVTIEVDSMELAIVRVTELAKRLNGAVANSSINTGEKNFRTARVVLRIPSVQFDAAMSGLNPIGKVESQNVGSEDVTEQFVDMTARMKNARRLEERLISLLATRTGKLEDVLAVERELARVREEIERYEGHLRYLSTRAAVSTITVNLHEKYPIVGAAPGQNVLVDAFRSAWRNFVNVVAGTISAIGALLPLLVLALLIALGLRKLGWLPGFRRQPPPPRPPSP